MAKQKSPTTDAPAAKKTTCPITKEAFIAKATPQSIKVGDVGFLVGNPKEFSTGSFGWHANEKCMIVIDGVPVKVQANVLLTVVGSKPEKE